MFETKFKYNRKAKNPSSKLSSWVKCPEMRDSIVERAGHLCERHAGDIYYLFDFMDNYFYNNEISYFVDRNDEHNHLLIGFRSRGVDWERFLPLKEFRTVDIYREIWSFEVTVKKCENGLYDIEVKYERVEVN